MDIETCEKCRGPLKIIACIEDPLVIRKILDHFKSNGTTDKQSRLPSGRAPPQIGLVEQT